MRPDSESTIQHVSLAQEYGGSEAALNMLQDQYKDFAQTHGGIASPSVSLYWNAVAQGLEAKGMFDGLAVEWGKEHMNVYTDRFSQGQLRVLKNDDPSFMDKDMIDSIARQFRGKDEVSRDDLTERGQQIQDQHQARDVVSRLMTSFDGSVENTLFAKIDRTNKVDGKIGIGDINDYVNQKMSDLRRHVFDNMQPAMRQQEFSDLKDAQWLQANWDKDPVILKLRGGHRETGRDSYGETTYNPYLTLDNLAKSAGYADRFDMLHNAVHQASPDLAQPAPVASAPAADAAPASAQPPVDQGQGQAVAGVLEQSRREREGERAVDHGVRQSNTHIVQAGDTWVSIAREALKNDVSCTLTLQQKVDELRHLNSYDFRTGVYKGKKGTMAARDVIKPRQRIALYSEAELDNQIEKAINE